MPTFSTLCLGNRNDADWWRRGMKEKLNFTEGKWVKNKEPSQADIASVFARTDDWLYLGGHFSLPPKPPNPVWPNWPYSDEKRLYNDLDNVWTTPPTWEVLFRSGKALLRGTATNGSWSEKSLTKGTEFKQTSAGHVLLFGGCAIADRKQDILAFQALFDSPLMLGWTLTTSRKMINLMLGGDGSNEANGAPWSQVNFWTKLGNSPPNHANVRTAWLAAADHIFTAGDPFRSHFAVIDATHVHALDKAPKKISDLP